MSAELSDEQINACLIGDLDAGSGDYYLRVARRIIAADRAARQAAPAQAVAEPVAEWQVRRLTNEGCGPWMKITGHGESDEARATYLRDQAESGRRWEVRALYAAIPLPAPTKGAGEPQSSSAWISVQDRLPAVKERVMFWRAEGFCFGYRRDDMSTVWMDESYQNADGEDTGCWGVTHWMPLPVPPTTTPSTHEPDEQEPVAVLIREGHSVDVGPAVGTVEAQREFDKLPSGTLFYLSAGAVAEALGVPQPTTLGGLSIDDINPPSHLRALVVAAWNHHLPDLRAALTLPAVPPAQPDHSAELEELRFYKAHGFPYVSHDTMFSEAHEGYMAIKLPMGWPHPDGEGTCAATIIRAFTVEQLYAKARKHIESLGPMPGSASTKPESTEP